MARTRLEIRPGDGLLRFEPVRRRLRAFYGRHPLGFRKARAANRILDEVR